MGRLIDIDVLFDYFGNDAIDETTRSNIEYFVREKGTVEAIPKADYEARLKAELAAMLEDLKQDLIAESWGLSAFVEDSNELVVDVLDIDKVFQQKINELKGGEND